MSEETNTKKFFTLIESPPKSDVNRHTRNNEDITLLRCRHSSTIEKLTKQFANNFNLHASKKKKSQNCKAPNKE